jgi:cytochrome oxidase Cu insertion factor (SCO1/SenC/PrrC family)
MKREWNRGLSGLCVAVALTCGCAAAAEQDGESESKEPPGIAVGKKAPDFVLQDQQGKERSLKEFIGEPEKEADDAVLALVFYRSADW